MNPRQFLALVSALVLALPSFVAADSYLRECVGTPTALSLIHI